LPRTKAEAALTAARVSQAEQFKLRRADLFSSFGQPQGLPRDPRRLDMFF